MFRDRSRSGSDATPTTPPPYPCIYFRSHARSLYATLCQVYPLISWDSPQSTDLSALGPVLPAFAVLTRMPRRRMRTTRNKPAQPNLCLVPRTTLATANNRQSLISTTIGSRSVPTFTHEIIPSPRHSPPGHLVLVRAISYVPLVCLYRGHTHPRRRLTARANPVGDVQHPPSFRDAKSSEFSLAYLRKKEQASNLLETGKLSTQNSSQDSVHG